MPLQCIARLRGQRLFTGKEVLGQRADIAGAFGQCRQCDFHRVEPVIQILAKTAVADHRRQIGIGGADHAHLGVAFTVGAQPLVTAGFQHAQQLHLPRQRQVADLVEKQRAAIGRFELAFARLVGAGVGTGFGTE